MTHLRSEIDVTSGLCQSLAVHGVHMTLSRSHYANKPCVSRAMKSPPFSMQHVTQGGLQAFGQHLRRPYMIFSTGENAAVPGGGYPCW